jgi:DNA-binding Lrp family transcriptional regulator
VLNLISDSELEVLVALQSLPLTSQPFREIAERLDKPIDEVLATADELLEKGYVRRFGPSINHRKMGYVANPMTVMRVPDDRLDEVGRIIASHPGVTHCYARSGWDYNLFFMTHAKTRNEGIAKAEKIVSGTGVSDYKLLFSIQEFKKTSLDITQLLDEGVVK